MILALFLLDLSVVLLYDLVDAFYLSFECRVKVIFNIVVAPLLKTPRN